MQSSHRLRPAMAFVRALLAPTASGDGAGERFCAPLPPSPPADREAVLQKRTEVARRTSEFTRKYRESAGTEIIDADEVLALFTVYEELFTLLEFVTGAPSQHQDTVHVHAGLMGAPAAGAASMLMTKDIAFFSDRYGR